MISPIAILNIISVLRSLATTWPLAGKTSRPLNAFATLTIIPPDKSLENATISPLHSAARQYAASGIPVFPCIPGTKKPLTEHGFHEATVDPEQIDKWWTQNPDANIAFTPHVMGWGIIDVDSQEAMEEFGQRNDEAEGEPTWMVKTPRGGYHFYYQGELPTSVRNRVIPGQAIDTRGRGSYALLPPSRTPDGVYETYMDWDVAPLPEWVQQAIQDTARGGAITLAPDVELDLPGNVARAVAYLKALSPALEGQGADNHTFVAAATLHNLAISPELAYDLMIEHYQAEPKDERFETFVARKIDNAYTYAQNSPGTHAVTATPDAFRIAAAKMGDDHEEHPGSRSRFYPEDETEQEEGKEPTWLITNLVPDQSSVMIYGPTQSYKSFLALDLALSTAANIATFAGAPIRSGPVFYAALEGRTDLKKKRRRAWKLARQVDAAPNFYTMPAPMLILPEEVEAFVQAIKDRLAGRQCAGIYLDTLAKIMAGMNENDARDAGQFIRFVDHLKETFSCPVFAIHHTGRDESHDRGSSSFRAGFDTVIKVTAHRATKMLTIAIEKHKDAEEPEEPWYMEGKSVGQSLVFQAVTRAAHDAATKAEALYTGKKIGAALKSLGAYGDDKAVTTSVLASVLVLIVEGEDVGQRQKKLASTTRTLAKLAGNTLEAYVSRSGRELAWSLPSQ